MATVHLMVCLHPSCVTYIHQYLILMGWAKANQGVNGTRIGQTPAHTGPDLGIIILLLGSESGRMDGCARGGRGSIVSRFSPKSAP